ncbi:hypothetical protein IOC57_07320 [Bacillus sp. SD075]|uniref:hypothetical protein n=1 Tax=Bacillus sp. SD075 TaxID=2781732 RepID=UPI001A969CB7|nr:hypothetical protein [Bacillus sp. SD075]MBO0997557.1 hypothetical protein [Bacillus sp. SD075]
MDIYSKNLTAVTMLALYRKEYMAKKTRSELIGTLQTELNKHFNKKLFVGG